MANADRLEVVGRALASAAEAFRASSQRSALDPGPDLGQTEAVDMLSRAPNPVDEGLRALRVERMAWIAEGIPRDLLYLRLASHYDAAALAIVRRAVGMSLTDRFSPRLATTPSHGRGALEVFVLFD